MTIKTTGFTLTVNDPNLDFDQIGRAMDLGLDLPGALSTHRFPDGLELQFVCLEDIDFPMELIRARSWLELILAGFDPTDFANFAIAPTKTPPPGSTTREKNLKLLQGGSSTDFAVFGNAPSKSTPPTSEED